MAALVVEAIHSVLPLRRCSVRLPARHTPAPDAVSCSPAQLGASMCPCAGDADRVRYDAAVAAARSLFEGNADAAVEHLRVRMTELAAAQRFEEAAMVRDRVSALLGAIRRQRLTDSLRAAGHCTVRLGERMWVVDHGRLVDVVVSGTAGRALPVDPPDAVDAGRPLPRGHVDEALVLAKYFDKHAGRLDVVACTGEWQFPLGSPPDLRLAA